MESGSIFVLGKLLFFFVIFILALATMNMTLIYLIISELTLFYLLMFSIILLLVYFDYMLSVVRLELCLFIGSYSTYSLGQWVSGRYCVRKWQFCHYENWASQFCHPTNGIHTFSILKRCTPSNMP